MIGFLWNNWSWLAALASGGLGTIALIVLGRPYLAYAIFALVPLLLAYTLYSAVRDYGASEHESGRLAGIQQVKDQQQALIDRLRIEKMEREEKIRDRDVEIATLRSVLDAQDRLDTEAAIKEAFNAASRDPACGPSDTYIGLWNGGLDRSNGAAGGSVPVVRPAGRPNGTVRRPRAKAAARRFGRRAGRGQHFLHGSGRDLPSARRGPDPAHQNQLSETRRRVAIAGGV